MFCLLWLCIVDLSDCKQGICKMKKLVLLALPIFALLLGSAQASYPDNLSNILAEDEKLLEKHASEDEISREQAARLILWAAAENQSKTSYKYGYRAVTITGEEKQKLQEILKSLSLNRKPSIMKALFDDRLKMQRQGTTFTVYADEGKQASFGLSFFQGHSGCLFGFGGFFTSYMKKTNARPSVMEDLLEAAFSLYQRQYSIDIDDIYQAYVSREDADLSVVIKFLGRAHEFSRDDIKEKIYNIYLSYGYPETYVVGGLTRPIVAELLNQAHNFSDNSDKVTVYAAYIKRADADLGVVNDLVNRAHAFPGKDRRMLVYAAYIARTDADLGVVNNLINWIRGLAVNICNIGKVYAAYIGRADADLDVANDLLNRSHDSSYKLSAYAAYLRKGLYQLTAK